MAELEDPGGQPPPPGLLHSLWRYRRTSLLVIVAIGLLFGLYGIASAASPSAAAQLTLVDPRGNNVFRQGNTAAVDLSRYTAQRASFARSDPVLDEASTTLGGRPTAQQLHDKVATSALSGTDIISITASANSIAEAEQILDAVVAAYNRQSQLETDQAAKHILDTLASERTRLQAELAAIPAGPVTAAQQAAAQNTAEALSQIDLQVTQARVSAALFGSGVSSVDRSEPLPGGGVADGIRLGVLGLLFGLILALALSWVRADREPVASEASFAARLLGAPIVAEVPHVRGRRERQQLKHPLTGALDSYNFAAATMRSIGVAGSVLLVGSRRGVGCTSSALSLAVASATEGRTVLLIDADMLSRGLTSLIDGDSASPGVLEVLDGQVLLRDAVQVVARKGEGRLDVLTAGRDDNGTRRPFVELSVAGLLRAAARLGYDLILIDAAPLADSPETVVVASQTDHFLAVVARETPSRDVEGLGRRLDLFPGGLVGTVFTRASRSSDS